ncbi:MAG: hypothetical protein AAF563_25275 [Pseudomonadota bacterium]
MDLIFMLTRDDKTVPDCMDVLDSIASLGVRHIGFKDVGVPKETMHALADGIREAGATSYFEVVSETPEDCLSSAQTAVDLGIDRLLGGSDITAINQVIDGTAIAYYPFAGFPTGHPTDLGGTPDDIAVHCRDFMAKGAAGVDLLAYRATDADPVDLVRAARDALNPGELIVAGSIRGPEQTRLMAELGVDGMTIGTALFDESFAPGKKGIVAQLKAALDAIP